MPSLSSTPSTTTFSSLYLHPTPQSILTSLDAQFTLPPALLTDLTHAFLREINLGLKGYGEDMAMVPSFITGVPDGSETGTFLALDLGGTNLRVCQVTLNGDKTFKLRQQKYKVSEGLKTGEAGVLFDYLADSVDAFLTMHPPESPESLSPPLDPNPNPNTITDVLPLGLTFSFPVEQTALGAGTILTWTKGFSAKNAIGHDVVRLLQDAFDRKHLHVRCVALVNDTVGAMLSRAYTSGGCILGAIFGTGTNGAYLERVENIPKLTLTNPSFADNTGYMVVNTEWGAFNNTRTHLPYTPFDTALDRTSINPRAQAFEKFISGMYLGELTRGVLVALVDAVVRGDVVGGEQTQAHGEGESGTQTQGEGGGETTTKDNKNKTPATRHTKPHSLLFNGLSTRVLNEKWALDTSVMSEVEEAWEAVDASSGTTENGGTGEGTTLGTGTEGMRNGAMEGGTEGTETEIGENPLWDGDDSGGLPDWEFLSGLDFASTPASTTPASSTPASSTPASAFTTTSPSSANTKLANTNTKLRTKLERVRQVVVRRLGYEDGEVRLRDAAIVRWVCHLVARRAALLSGVAVAAVLIQTGRAGFLGGGEGEGVNGENGTNVNENGTMNGNGNGTNGENGKKTDEEKIGVGVDGSLIQHYPHFERTMRESLRSIVGAAVERRVEIGLAKDGSGVGAALCALQALKQQQLQPQPQLQ